VKENILPEDKLYISNSASPLNLTKHFQRYAATKGITWTSASCSKVLKDLTTDKDLVECVRCDSLAICNSQIKSLPDIIVLEIVKKNDGPLPYHPHLKENMLVRGNTYKLVGIIYYSHARSHYWSDVFVQGTSPRNLKTGWYTNNGGINNGAGNDSIMVEMLPTEADHLFIWMDSIYL